MPVELYKVHTSRERGSVSSGKVEYFTDPERLQYALLSYKLQEEQKKASWFLRQLLSFWDEMRSGFSDVDKEKVTKVYLVAKLVDMEWVELRYEFTPPDLILSEHPGV